MLTRNVPRALAALALIAAGFAVIAAGAVPAIAAQLQNVFVTNTPDKPVPTAAQGVTQVSGTVSVAAPAEEVVQFRRAVTVQPSETSTGIERPLYDVPDGKRLIVDLVTANLPSVANTDFFVDVGQNQGAKFTLPLVKLPGRPDFDRFAGSLAGPIHVDAVDGQADELTALLFRASPPDIAVAYFFSVSGRLVDRP